MTGRGAEVDVERAAWDPLKELAAVQRRMNKLFESALGGSGFESEEEPDMWTPACDVYDTPGERVFCLELPGMEQERIDVRVEGDELVVSGAREIEREQPGHRFQQVERSYGRFARRFALPETVDGERVSASYRDGVLRIALARAG